MQHRSVKYKSWLRSLFYGGCTLGAVLLAGCKKEPVAAAANVGVQTIPLQDTLRKIITENILLTNNHPWYIEGWVYVSNEATLHIEPGTVIKIITPLTAYGKESGGGLVITRGAKIVAEGLQQLPVLFRLNDTTCNTGWKGIILLGKAPQTGAGKVLENISSLTGSTGLAYGGQEPEDSSGVMRHVRMEGMELLLRGTGSRTVIADITIQPTGNKPYHLKKVSLP
ncbi:hypothetical protein [Chitinophaga sp. GbtcB8]|uniref:hypothetical protein n=1 Tax=Chitinophaga sp. GbtcB8 TaxID=2824753 RepID=UPI001C2FD232|nr:hypothetical protein [Chitinophaga sp. GbtcB8]